MPRETRSKESKSKHGKRAKESKSKREKRAREYKSKREKRAKESKSQREKPAKDAKPKRKRRSTRSSSDDYSDQYTDSNEYWDYGWPEAEDKELDYRVAGEEESYWTTTQRYKETSRIHERSGVAYHLYDESSMSELLEAERARVLRRDTTIQRGDERSHDLQTRLEKEQKKIEALEADLRQQAAAYGSNSLQQVTSSKRPTRSGGNRGYAVRKGKRRPESRFTPVVESN